MTWALVPAAGSGRRFGGGVPKQYLQAAGKPLIAHALEALLAHPQVDGAVVALAETGAAPPRKSGWTSRPMCQSWSTIAPPWSCTARVIGCQPSTCSSLQMPGAPGQPSPSTLIPVPSVMMSPAPARWR